MLYANATHRPRTILYRIRRHIEAIGSRAVGPAASFICGGLLGALLAALIICAW